MAVMDRFSVFAFALGDPPPTASELIAAARHADSLGFHSISLPHHLTLPAAQVYTGFPRRDILDPLALLPAMAAVTRISRWVRTRRLCRCWRHTSGRDISRLWM